MIKENNNLKLKLNKTKAVLGTAMVYGGITGLVTSGPTLMIWGGCGHISLGAIATMIGGCTLLGGIAGGVEGLNDWNYENEKKNEEAKSENTTKVFTKK